MKKLLILLAFITSIAHAQTRQTGGISFTPQWNFKISGSDTTWQFGNTIMSPQQFPYFLTKWQSDQRYASVGGYVPNTRNVLNGYGILGGTQLNVDITKSVDTTVIGSKTWANAKFINTTTIAGYAKLAGGNNFTGNQTISSGGSDGLYFGYGATGSGYGALWNKNIVSKTLVNAGLVLYDGLTSLQSGTGGTVEFDINGNQKFAVDNTDTYVVNRLNLFSVGTGTTANTILTRNGNVIEEIPYSSSFNPMTTQGDIIYGGASGVPTRLAKGTTGYFLQAGGSAPQYFNLFGTSNTWPSTQFFTGGIQLGSSTGAGFGNYANFYGSSTGYTEVKSANASGTNYAQLLPAASGTLALTSDIPSAGTYINNGTSQQASSNFNISGLGVATNFKANPTGNPGFWSQGAYNGNDFEALLEQSTLTLAANTNRFYSGSFRPNITATSNGNMTNSSASYYGLASQPSVTSGAAGTINNMGGLYVQMTHSSATATVDYATGVRIESPLVNNSAVYNNFQGLNIKGRVGSNKGTNNVNILIGSYISPAGNWNLYSSNTDASYHAGNFQIGSATATAGAPKLDVTGTIGSTALTASQLVATDANKVLVSVATTTLTANTLSKTANYAIVAGDFAAGKAPILDLYVDATAGAVAITLPSAATFSGYTIYVTKTDASVNAVTVSTVAGLGILAAQYNSGTYMSNGTSFYNH